MSFPVDHIISMELQPENMKKVIKKEQRYEYFSPFFNIKFISNAIF